MKNYGYKDDKDEDWATEAASTSESGLPYGVSPSSKRSWDETRHQQNKKDAKRFFRSCAFLFASFFFVVWVGIKDAMVLLGIYIFLEFFFYKIRHRNDKNES